MHLVRAQIAAADPFERALAGMAYCSLDGRFLRVNEALCELFGRSAAELLTTTWPTVVHTDEQPLLDVEQRYARPDGSILVAQVRSELVVVDGEPQYFAQVRDVTDESDSLAALVAAERRFRAVADASSDVIIWRRTGARPADIYVSNTATAATGYRPDDFYADASIGEELVHAADRHLIDALLAQPDHDATALVRWHRRDGSLAWMEQRVALLPTPQGHAPEVLHVARDVTDRVLADTARARQDAQQHAVTGLAQASLSGHDLPGVVNAAAADVRRLAPGEMSAVWWETEPGGAFTLAGGVGFAPAADAPRCTVDGTWSHPARVRANNAVTTFHPASAVGAPPDCFAREGITAGVGVPIRSDGRVVGVLASYGREHLSFSPADVTFLHALANTLGAYAERTHYDDLLSFRSLHDSVTGLPNKALFLAELERLAHAAHRDGPVLVAVCGLDDVDLFEHALGPEFAAQLLVGVAARLTAIEGVSLTARTGSDEFALAFQPAEGQPTGDLIGSMIIAAMQLPLAVAGRQATASMSVGLTTQADADKADDTLAEARAALHRARLRGRGHWLYASGDEQAEAARRLELTARLREAVATGGVEAFFQPIVCLDENEIVGYEALARWTTAEGRVISPAEFIPIAEETGIIHSLGLAMLDQACGFLASARRRTGGRHLIVTVNFSPRQLDVPDLAAQIEMVLQRHDIPRDAVCLELTESALVPGDGFLIDRLQALKALGISLAIDDFGTGYSSFAYLTQFPIDLLKLDRAFVTALDQDPRRIAVAHSIITLARTLGITVLAEGIETSAERDTLRGLECQMGQGFVWSRALRQLEAIDLLTSEPETVR